MRIISVSEHLRGIVYDDCVVSTIDVTFVFLSNNIHKQNVNEILFCFFYHN